MRNRSSVFGSFVVATLLAGVSLAVSCSQAPPVAPTPAPPSEVGRFQVIVASDSGRVVFLLADTKDGTTWIYRAPQSPLLVNGFWSDIPRITYGPDIWQRAFSQMATLQQQAGAVTNGTAAVGTTEAPLPVVPPTGTNR